MFSNIDEHVRRLPRRPASAALHPGLSQERSMLVSRDGRHLDPGKVGRIDVRRLERGHSTGNRALCVSVPGEGERCQRVSSAERPTADKAAALSPHRVKTRTVVAERPEAGTVPSSTWAAGGWMTARWSGAVTGTKAATPGAGTSSKSNAGGFPTASGEGSPERALLKTGARDARRRL